MRPRTRFSSVHLRMLEPKHGKKETFVGQVCWPMKQLSEPWIAFAGDCFFFDLQKKFSQADLDGCDCPLILAVRRGKVNMVMDLVEANLPESAKMLIVQVGYADLLSAKISPKEAAHELYERCLRLRKAHPHLEEIAVCLLSYRLASTISKYRRLYIGWFNSRVKEFNKCICRYNPSEVSLTVLNFGLQVDYNIFSNVHKKTILSPTGSGQDLIPGILASLIKFKRSTSNGSGRCDHGMPLCHGQHSNLCVTLPRSIMTTAPSVYQTSGDIPKLSLPLPETPYSKSEMPHCSNIECGSETEKRKLDPEFHDCPKKPHSIDKSDELDYD